MSATTTSQTEIAETLRAQFSITKRNRSGKAHWVNAVSNYGFVCPRWWVGSNLEIAIRSALIGIHHIWATGRLEHNQRIALEKMNGYDVCEFIAAIAIADHTNVYDSWHYAKYLLDAPKREQEWLEFMECN